MAENLKTPLLIERGGVLLSVGKIFLHKGLVRTEDAEFPLRFDFYVHKRGYKPWT